LSEKEGVEKLTNVIRLLALTTRPRIEELKKELLKNPQHKKAYEALDGTKTVMEISRKAGYSPRGMEGLLPEWERMGLILSIGKGKGKRYVNLENMDI